MKRLCTIISWIVELAIAAGLVWKLSQLYDLSVPRLLVLLSPFLALIHWINLRKKHIEKKVMLKLFFLTGPCVILSFSLLLNEVIDLTTVARLRGGISKEMRGEYLEKGVPHEYVDQWFKDRVERMKSDGLIYAMFFVSTCILYGNRCSLGRLEDSEKPPTSEDTT